MNVDKYVTQNQAFIDNWSARFNCLFYWNIKFVYDGEHWSRTMYNTKTRTAIIYPCDIDDEQSYLVHEIIKLCFISVENDMNAKLELITDLTTVLMRDGV